MKISLAFLVGCLLGLAGGWFLRGDASAGPAPRGFELDTPEASGDGNRYSQSPSGQNDRGSTTDDPSSRGPVGVDRESRSPRGNANPDRVTPTRTLTLRVEGEGGGRGTMHPAVLLQDGGQRRFVAVPQEALRGARAAVVEGGRDRFVVDRIARRDPSAGIIYLSAPSRRLDVEPARLAAAGVRTGDVFDVIGIDADALPRKVSVAFFGGAQDRDRGRAVLDRDLARDGVAFDAKGFARGLALARGREAAVLAALDASALDAAEALDLSLDEYRRLYYEGTFEAWINSARAHYAARRYASALEAFRAAERVGSGRLEERDREAWLASHRALLASIPNGSHRPRLRALEDALVDFPNEGDLEVSAARAAFALEEWDLSLEHWERADRVDPDRVGDLDAAKTGVFRAWAESHVRAKRTRDAIDVLDRALREVRGDAELLAMFGRLLLKIRDYAGAAEALREAVRLDPRLEGSLGDLIARADRFTEGPGKVVIDYAPGQRSIIATVRLNDRVSGEFIVDTGATASFIPEAIAARAGLDTSDRVPRVTVRTAGNERRLPYSPLDELSVGGLSVRDINVIVGDLPGTAQRGLLGMDFLGQFGFENDAVNGRFVIFERR